MQRNAQRLLHLVNQLLDFSKLEAGKMKLETSQGDLVPFLRRITDAFASLAEKRNIHFTVHLPDEGLWVSFDSDKLEMILNNLLSNAFKFTRDNGQISVSLILKPYQINPTIPAGQFFTQAELSIRDTGIGIPPEQIERIFDRFHQVDNSHTREQEGTGIGLSLTRELVELHGGTITVVSELGKGSHFTVSLPLVLVNAIPLDKAKPFVEEVHPVLEATIAQLSVPISIESETDLLAPLVLLVEDNADLRQFLRQSLSEHLAYRVIEAVHGGEGLRQALEYIPDLIVSDVQLQ
jgi:two-component sensor histidine kinase